MNLSSVLKNLPCLILGVFSMAGVAGANLAITDDPKAVAIVNGYTLPLASVDLIYQSVSQGKQPMQYKDLVNGIIENRLLGEYAESEIGLSSLMTNNPVGFPVETYLDDQYIGLIQTSFHQSLSDYIKVEIGDSPESITSFFLREHRAQLSSILDMKNRMEYVLTPEQQNAAEQLIIAKFVIPEEVAQSITLLDIYKRQNIQGRIKIHQLDLDFLSAQVNQFVVSKVINAWSRKYSGLTDLENQALKQFIKDRHYKTRVIAYHGVSEDIHDDNLVLDAAFKRVTQSEIKKYYDRHKEKFKHIEYVEARHIRLADFELAVQAKAALDDGMDFSEAAEKFSIAKTKHSNPSGGLGKVRAKDNSSRWVKSALFALNVGTASRPIRSPQADGKTVYWEIFLVDKRKESYFDVTSETVRYLAGKEVARQNLEADFLRVRNRLFETADIKVNPELMVR